jgi:transposase
MKRGIGEATVEGIINRHIDQQVDWQKIKAIPLLGIDEIALKKGHKDFVVIVSAINEHSGFALICMKAIAMLFMRCYRVVL